MEDRQERLLGFCRTREFPGWVGCEGGTRLKRNVEKAQGKEYEKSDIANENNDRLSAGGLSCSKKQASITPFNWVQQVAADRAHDGCPFFEIISSLGTCRTRIPKTETAGSTWLQKRQLRRSLLRDQFSTRLRIRGVQGQW